VLKQFRLGYKTQRVFCCSGGNNLKSDVEAAKHLMDRVEIRKMFLADILESRIAIISS
jgi:hypothetical protein